MTRKVRARDLGVPFEGQPGPLNAITDVEGVEVGHVTLVEGEGPLNVGQGPVRTGVTAVLPRGRRDPDPVFGGWFSLNGNGEMTGTTWLEESGFLEGPVTLTNTHSVGTVRDAVIGWQVRSGTIPNGLFSLPVVSETWDGRLNDVNGFHVRERHVVEALESAAGGPVAEGNVGGGTGTICHGFKGGIGTASRWLDEPAGGFTVGVLAQCNHGSRLQLRIAGVPVGLELSAGEPSSGEPPAQLPPPGARDAGESGSIVVLIATDAPLLPHQLKRLARRGALGLARNGSVAGNGSGDLFLAFSTANSGVARPAGIARAAMLPNDRMDPLFAATVEATEEAIVNALVAAETMTGADGRRVEALPHEALRDVLRRHGRLLAGGELAAAETAASASPQAS
ncbi:MAG: P1 family peptidase [Gemmatimonadota bacterium]